MITFTDPTFALYIRAAGYFFRVTAICNTDDEANDYCVANPGESVLAEDTQQGRIYIAEDRSANLPAVTLKQAQERALAKAVPTGGA